MTGELLIPGITILCAFKSFAFLEAANQLTVFVAANLGMSMTGELLIFGITILCAFRSFAFFETAHKLALLCITFRSMFMIICFCIDRQT